MTKKYRFWATVLMVLSLLLTVGPFLGYTIAALAGGALVVEKVCLVSTLLIVAIMSLVALVNKTVMKSRLWILLIGLYLCIDNIMTPLLIIAGCQVVDELIVSPLAKIFSNKATIHGELDKRL